MRWDDNKTKEKGYWETVFECPHCGKDKRTLPEILESLEGVLEDFNEEGIGEFDIPFFRDSINAGLELKEVKSDPINYDKLKVVKKTFDEVSSLLFDYEHDVGFEDEEDKESYAIAEIIPNQKKLKNELMKLAKELEMNEEERMR